MNRIQFLQLRVRECETQTARVYDEAPEQAMAWTSKGEAYRECIQLLKGRINTNVEFREGFVRSKEVKHGR